MEGLREFRFDKPFRFLQETVGIDQTVAGSVVAVIGGLFVITVVNAIYQIYFSPLSSIPGPFFAKFSNLYLFSQKVLTRRCFVTHDLFKKYGPVVRVEPNHIAFLDEAATREYGRFNKAPMYSGLGLGGIETSIATIDTAKHASKRRITGQAYSVQNVNTYEHEGQELSKELVRRVVKDGESGKKSIDVVQLVRFYALDFLGIVSLGLKFDNVKEKDGHLVVELLDGILIQTGYHLPNWFVKFLEALPIPGWKELVISDAKLCRYAASHVDEVRQQIKDGGGVEHLPRQTLFTRILTQPETRTKTVMPDGDCVGEVAAHLFAGTDTTGITIAHLVYNLTFHLEVVSKLVDELKTAMPDPLDIPSFKDLSALPYLNAVVKEGLRLYGAAPSSLERTVPAEGFRVGKYFIPAGTTVSTQPWSMNRVEEAFSEPDKFKPERWLDTKSEEEMRKWFSPWGFGSRNCVGMNLANVELRLLIATLFRNFDIALDPTVPVEKMRKGMEMIDIFLVPPAQGHCKLRFIPRKA